MADRQIYLSSEAASELKDMPKRDRDLVSQTLLRLRNADNTPELHALDVPGTDEPYFTVRSGPYRIVFRYLPPEELPGFEDPSRRGVMVASILRRDRQDRLF